MKLRWAASSVILVLFCSGFVLAQFVANGSEPKACSTNGVSFVCPAGFEVRTSKATGATFLAYEAKSRTTIFAFASSEKVSSAGLAEQVLGKVVEATFGVPFSSFQQKESQDFWSKDKFSEFEVSRIANVGYNPNKQNGIHLHVVELLHRKTPIVVGFVYLAADGNEAQNWYTKWHGGGNMTATYALQRMINSITGEERKDYEAPGGPPPMAAPKTKTR